MKTNLSLKYIDSCPPIFTGKPDLAIDCDRVCSRPASQSAFSIHEVDEEGHEEVEELDDTSVYMKASDMQMMPPQELVREDFNRMLSKLVRIPLIQIAEITNGSGIRTSESYSLPSYVPHVMQIKRQAFDDSLGRGVRESLLMML